MRPYRISTLLFLLLLLLATLPAAAEEIIRLGDDVVPTFEAVHLTLDADKSDYSGKVRIDLEVRKASSRFRFHSEGLELQSLVLEGPQGEIETSHEAESDDVVLVHTPTPLAPGLYSLSIEFTNAFDTQAVSLYRAQVDGSGSSFKVGKVEVLFEVNPRRPGWIYDVTKDGERFVVNTSLTSAPVSPVTLITNWDTELQDQ